MPDNNISINHFRIADFCLTITFKGYTDGMALLPSFEPFAIEELNTDDQLFEVTIDDTTKPAPKEQRTRIRDFETGNGHTIVDKLNDGGYQYIIKDINGYECCLLVTNKTFTQCRCALNGNYNMRSFGLNNALMLVFAFSGAHKQALLMHASVVRQNDYGYPFIAKSGTGKSTQVSMWLRYLPGCDLMNDDNPIIRIIDDKPVIYGGPWSGKTPCYRNVKAPLGAVTRIARDEKNYVEKLVPLEAFASVLPSVSAMKWDTEIYELICDTVKKIVETTDIYILHCLPNREAAEICNKTIRKA